jgi:hypothetical protein
MAEDEDDVGYTEIQDSRTAPDIQDDLFQVWHDIWEIRKY